MSTKPFRILIAPLNWGLGHATRCLPIASAFAKTNSVRRSVEIHWASDGQALALLKAELPVGTPIHELPSYGVRYPTRSASVNMVLGGPKMGAAILQEAKAVEALHNRYAYDFILSDNRFGCRVPGVASAILTHQVHLPIRNWFSRKLGTLLNHRLLAKFDQIVVPDVPNKPRLAGAMSAPHPKVQTNYIGSISRFQTSSNAIDKSSTTALAIVLSGPEPQRTKLEIQLLQSIANSPNNGTVLLVRGRPDKAPSLAIDLLKKIAQNGTQLEVHDFMGTKDLEGVFAKAEIIISRPGYTTVMDLSVLGRAAIYVPTPGQPEQEWLGKSLERAGVGICVKQQQLVLAKAIQRFQNLQSNAKMEPTIAANLLDTWVANILNS